MIRPPDAGHPIIEQFASDLCQRTPVEHWPEHLRKTYGSWEQITPELRAWFRDRARTFASGDMRVAPWNLSATLR